MGTGQRVGYKRVSTVEQTTDRQLDGLPLDRVFTEHASGKNTERPELQKLVAYVREGDTLVVHSMDRLARNLDDLRRLVRDLTGKRVRVEFVKEAMTFTGDDAPMATLMLSMMGAFAEFERALIRERQREGVALAKARGAYKGRRRVLTCDQIEALRQRAIPGANKAALAREFGIGRRTLYAYLADGRTL
jgi:DNA invertase Pin-like site-specific DNA recombinase